MFLGEETKGLVHGKERKSVALIALTSLEQDWLSK